MAPPRQRTTAVQDDSRSEASSTTTKEVKTTTVKGRKGANGAATTSVSREVKASSNVTSAPATQGEQSENFPRVRQTRPEAIHHRLFYLGSTRSSIEC